MLDEITGRFIYKNKFIHLTPQETSILEYLILNKNNIVTKEQLSAFGYGNNDGINVLRVHIHRLNQKLRGILIIFAKRGFGYGIEYIGE